MTLDLTQVFPAQTWSDILASLTLEDAESAFVSTNILNEQLLDSVQRNHYSTFDKYTTAIILEDGTEVFDNNNLVKSRLPELIRTDFPKNHQPIIYNTEYYDHRRVDIDDKYYYIRELAGKIGFFKTKDNANSQLVRVGRKVFPSDEFHARVIQYFYEQLPRDQSFSSYWIRTGVARGWRNNNLTLGQMISNPEIPFHRKLQRFVQMVDFWNRGKRLSTRYMSSNGIPAKEERENQIIGDGSNYRLLTKINEVYEAAGYKFFYFGWYHKDYPGLYLDKVEITPQTLDYMSPPILNKSYFDDEWPYYSRINIKSIRTWSRQKFQTTLLNIMDKQGIDHITRPNVGLPPKKLDDEVINYLNRDYLQIVKGLKKVSHWGKEIDYDGRYGYDYNGDMVYSKMTTNTTYSPRIYSPWQWSHLYRRLFITTDFLDWTTISAYRDIPEKRLDAIIKEFYYNDTDAEFETYEEKCQHIMAIANVRKSKPRQLTNYQVRLPLGKDTLDMEPFVSEINPLYQK